MNYCDGCGIHSCDECDECMDNGRARSQECDCAGWSGGEKSKVCAAPGAGFWGRGGALQGHAVGNAAAAVAACCGVAN